MANPPMKSSDEANRKQLDLAREQGSAYLDALKTMAFHEADQGGEQAAGDYVIAYAVEKAEGMYHLQDGELVWQEPTDENVHIEISVRDASDNRFIPGLTVFVRLIDSSGADVGYHEMPFLWHPWLYHYGRNWHVPSEGVYQLVVRIEPPAFGRHDHKNGLRYSEPVEVTFEHVKITTGQKKST